MGFFADFQTEGFNSACGRCQLTFPGSSSVFAVFCAITQVSGEGQEEGSAEDCGVGG